MGSGMWTTTSFANYTTTTKAVNLSAIGTFDGLDNSQIFKAKKIADDMNPYNIVRECLDTSEHPQTKPVILAIDVTGSMGQAGVEVASKINVFMTELYNKFTDIEFCIMGIGDLAYDHCPIQMSQFESDVRIAEHLDKVYFEFGGGGNHYESYTAAWYMGLYHTKLDCWKRNKKGIIITIGDEPINPYLPKNALSSITGDNLEADVETKQLYDEVIEKFNVFHIDVEHNSRWSNHMDEKKRGYESIIGDHYYQCNLNSITETIITIIKRGFAEDQSSHNHEISW